jgi:toxin ParE1/3/4
VAAAVERYQGEGGEQLALRFIDALEAAFEVLGDNPLSGSPRYAFELEIPELRAWSVRTFPYVVFYVDRDARIDVWRVLHERRDVSSAMADVGDSWQ